MVSCQKIPFKIDILRQTKTGSETLSNSLDLHHSLCPSFTMASEGKEGETAAKQTSVFEGYSVGTSGLRLAAQQCKE